MELDSSKLASEITTKLQSELSHIFTRLLEHHMSVSINFTNVSLRIFIDGGLQTLYQNKVKNGGEELTKFTNQFLAYLNENFNRSIITGQFSHKINYRIDWVYYDKNMK